MSIVCGKCSYVRGQNEHVPDWQCPSCGVAYNKVKKIQKPVIEAKSIDVSSSVISERQALLDLESRLDLVITGQQYMIYAVFIPLVIFLISNFIYIDYVFKIPIMVYILAPVSLLIIAMQVLGVLYVLSGTASSILTRVLYTIGAFIPFLNLIVFLSVNRKANTYLKYHGYDVGVLGPRGSFLDARKFYGVLLIFLIGIILDNQYKAINPELIAKKLNHLASTPTEKNGFRFDGIKALQGGWLTQNKYFLEYKYTLLDYESESFSPRMEAFFSDGMIKENVCKVQNLHRNFTLIKADYSLRAIFYNKYKKPLKAVNFELDDCRAYRK